MPDFVPCCWCGEPAHRTLFYSYKPVCEDCKPGETRSTYCPDDPADFLLRAFKRRGIHKERRYLEAIEASLGLTPAQARTIASLLEGS